jgi:protein-arginine deiminase
MTRSVLWFAAVSLAACGATPAPGPVQYVTGGDATGDAAKPADAATATDAASDQAPEPETTPADITAPDIAAPDVPTTGDMQQPPVTAAGGPDLVVDADRDGLVDPSNAGDQDFETVFDGEHGATFLPNLDDDDGDHLEDVFDEIVNGPDDELDLTRVVLRPWPQAPAGSKGVLSLDPEGAKHVRLWVRTATGDPVLILGAWGKCFPKPTGACTNWSGCAVPDCTYQTSQEFNAGTIHAGLELAIEGLGFRMDEGWSGEVTITLTIIDESGKPVASKDAPDGKDEVKLRVAPWMLHGNTSKFDKVRSHGYSKPFVTDLNVAVPAADLLYETHNYNGVAMWNDVWTQDFFQTGWVSVPAPGGKVHGMRLFNARPWGREGSSGKQTEDLLPITWLRKNVLAKDSGVFRAYLKDWYGSTYDSHGNHDLLPPYKKGNEAFPVGRILTGDGVLKDTQVFYKAQRAQAPVLVVNTKWLVVGHCDEILSYYPAKTERGWKLAVASDKMAKEMYEAAQKAGHGAVKQFIGKKNYDPLTDEQKNAEISIDDVLKDENLLKWSEIAGVETAKALDTVVQAVGLAKDEVIPIPFLTEALGGQKKVAWNPGTVNSLIMGDFIAMPNPWGPVIAGADMFQKDLQDRLGTAVNGLGKAGAGMKVYFVDDWSYHVGLGEVHCGTNPEGAPLLGYEWWKTGK